jgi:hypothetical protein
MRNLQKILADPIPRPVSTSSHGSRAICMPAEVIESALHWLTAHPAPPELHDLVAALVAQDRRALGVT